MTTDWQRSLFFGDLHNHNALGYGLGSLERSIDIAQTHLDFFAFTGHSSWHDMPAMEGDRQHNWSKGFRKLEEAWPKVQQLAASANTPHEFVSYLGFEWHSSMFGDQCVVLPDDNHPLIFPDRIDQLRNYCRQRNGLMIPHHLAYKTGHRGVNWDVFDSECSPVVEIYSEHGNGLSDRGDYDYFNHSMGGRVTTNTADHALQEGLEFGFVASSDNHRGFPGAYGEGLLGVWADELTRPGIFEAIKQRRTIALTGDRIHAFFSVDGYPLGSQCRASTRAELQYVIDGRDEIDVVDVVVNGRIQSRIFPDLSPDAPVDRGRFQLRYEWGWGPWNDMDLDRVCDWDFTATIVDGRLLNVYPCLRSGPFDEARRHRISWNEEAVDVISYTGRKGAYRQNPNQSIVFEIEGTPASEIQIESRRPKVDSFRAGLAGLMTSSEMIPTGPFPAESGLLHRIVRRSESSMDGSVDVDLNSGKNTVYLQIRQKNGQMAWASPVFIDVK